MYFTPIGMNCFQGWILSSESLFHSFFLDPLSLPLWPYSHLQASPVTLFLAVSSLTVKCVTGLSPDFLYKSLGLYVGLYQVLGSPVTNTQL